MQDALKEFWTVEEFADWMRITPIAARGILRRRELPPEAVLKIGRRVRIVVSVAREWIRQFARVT